MIKKPDSNKARIKRHLRVRNKISGTPERPRLNVFRSAKHIYAQLIDDVNGVTLVSASSLEKDFEGNGGNKEAAKKASIHDFIMSTPDGYDTKLAELGDSISGGEKQRIGIARAFLHDSEMIFLDEPTSNIDSLNEGMILRSLEQEKKDKTIILVSHRKSTMGIADEVIAM